jgi:hypothetical protein
MPSTTEKQRRFMGAELERLREGLKTRTGMSERQLEDFARKPTRGDRPERHTERRSHITAATLLMRRLRFGSEWL